MRIYQLARLISTGIAAMAVIAEIEAMKAGNQEHKLRGQALPYSEASFRQMADRIYGLAQDAQAQGGGPACSGQTQEG